MKSPKPWLAIINLEQGQGPRPIVILTEQLDEPQAFLNVEEIEKFREKSSVRLFDWFAFNFVTGESVEL